MKKLILPLLFSVFGVLLFLGFSDTECKASAYGSQPNILYAETEELTESMIVSNGYRNRTGLSQLQAGDYRVDLMIQNNTGYRMLSINYYMSNSYYEPYLTQFPLPAYIKGPAADNMILAIVYNQNQNVVGFSVIGTDDNLNDGLIVSCFIKRKQNAPSGATVPSFSSSNVSMSDGNQQPLNYTEVQPAGQTQHVLLAYTIGDVNGDGSVTASDASAILTVFNSTNVTLTASNAEAYFIAYHQSSGNDIDGMYGQSYFIFDVADVNQDGILDSDDAYLIQDYFMCLLIGLDPLDDPTIAHIGTTGYYVA